jgi:hypothetical protein
MGFSSLDDFLIGDLGEALLAPRRQQSPRDAGRMATKRREVRRLNLAAICVPRCPPYSAKALVMPASTDLVLHA